MILLIISGISIDCVSALGMAPSKKIIDYSTEEQTISGRIINNEGKDTTIKMSAEGELSEYITINTPLLEIKSYEPEKDFTYTIKLPPDITPGTKMISITGSEISMETENSIGGLLSVTQQLLVLVPYAGKYAEGYVSISPIAENTPVIISINIINKGAESIGSVNGRLSIRGYDGKERYHDDIYVNDGISPQESKKVDNSFMITEAGSYIAEYYIYYDNKNFSISKEFDVGTYEIDLKNTSVKNFRLGTIAKFDIAVSTNWNKQIEDIHGEIIIQDKEGNIIGQTSIPGKAINPGEDSLTAYWDTSNIGAGEYVLSVKLFSGNEVITKEYESRISEDNILIGTETGTIEQNKGGWGYVLAASLTIIALAILTLLVIRQNKKLYK
jgi:hypothetical protein